MIRRVTLLTLGFVTLIGYLTMTDIRQLVPNSPAPAHDGWEEGV